MGQFVKVVAAMVIASVAVNIINKQLRKHDIVD